MDYDRLKVHAQHLEEVAMRYARQDPEADLFYEAIKPWLEKATAGLISEPVEPREFPSRAFFEEGSLGKYPELESAYSKFVVEATDITHHLAAVDRILANLRR